MLVARLLGREMFGRLGIIQNTVGMLQVFAGFGVGLTATKYVAEFRGRDPVRVGRIIAFSHVVAGAGGVLFAAALFVLAAPLASRTLAEPLLAGLLRVGAVLLFTGAVNGAQMGVLAGFEAFRAIAVANLVSGLIALPLLVGGAHAGGLCGGVVALAVGGIASCLVNHAALRSVTRKAGVPIRLWPSQAEWSMLWNFGLPAALSSALVTPVHWVCSAMLVNRPGGYHEMGAFNAANQWFGALLFLPGVLSNTMLPLLCERMAASDRARAGRVLGASLVVNAVLILPLVAVGCAFSPWIMRLYGPDFGGTWPTLVVSLITAGLLAVQTPVGQVIAATGRMWLGFAMNFGWAVGCILLTGHLLYLGSMGLALARLGAYGLHAIWTFGFAALVCRRKPPTPAVIPCGV